MKKSRMEECIDMIARANLEGIATDIESEKRFDCPSTAALRVRNARYAISRLLEELRETGKDRDEFARTILWNGVGKAGDHACSLCHPDSQILTKGFVCAYHRAERIFKDEPEETRQGNGEFRIAPNTGGTP
jgi:hypothetical protein